MIRSIQEFFSNLPDKCCSTCGIILSEMADCYQNECDDCQDHTFYTIHVK